MHGETRTIDAATYWSTPSADVERDQHTTRTVRSARALATADVERLATSLTARQPSKYERFVKPVIDRVAALVLLIVISPVLVVSMTMLLLAVGRPLVFRQTRVGRDGQPFSMLKFRTMHPDRRVSEGPFTGPERRLTHKSAQDPRHTRVGRWLRKTSIDELPQLVNVLRGQMSLVGPRPELIALVESYEPWQHARHVVKPGLTGLWQTTERGRGRLLHECVDLDLQYIAGLSLRRDASILLRTPLALLRNKGVV